MNYEKNFMRFFSFYTKPFRQCHKYGGCAMFALSHHATVTSKTFFHFSFFSRHTSGKRAKLVWGCVKIVFCVWHENVFENSPGRRKGREKSYQKLSPCAIKWKKKFDDCRVAWQNEEENDGNETGFFAILHPHRPPPYCWRAFHCTRTEASNSSQLKKRNH